jgi:hypothetical protein
MMLVLAPSDFQKLSRACRTELLQLLMPERDVAALHLLDETPDVPGPPEPEDVVAEEKQVVSLTAAEAADLLANIGKRSSDTLREFALGQPVPIGSLIGEGKPYKDNTELKRSFVAAVNRRLRTVYGTRNAALFMSDRDRTKIRVTPQTARSLRRVFQLAEAPPALQFYDEQGQKLESTASACQLLQRKVLDGWSHIDYSKIPESQVECFAWTMREFVAQGFELVVRVPKIWDEDTQRLTYELHSVADPFGAIENWVSERDPGELLLGDPGEPSAFVRPIL